MHELERVARHLLKPNKTVHAVGGMGLLVVQFVELVHILVWNEQSVFSQYIMLILTMPYAVGLLASQYLRQRIQHSTRSPVAIYNGMVWVCAFNTLACSAYADRTFQFDSISSLLSGSLPATMAAPDIFQGVCTLLFYIFLALSVLLTVLEVIADSPRGNGWVFGVVFTHLTLLFPVVMHLYLGTDALTDLYRDRAVGVGQTIYYTCLHNSILVSLSFFVISMRDTKVLSECFVDTVGRYLWTVPNVPLAYVALLRTTQGNFAIANTWLAVTSCIAGFIIYGQKKRGWFVSTLRQDSSKSKPGGGDSRPIPAAAPQRQKRFLGLFLRGLVWDDEHLAFESLDPSPQYSWGLLAFYWMVCALSGSIRRYWDLLFENVANPFQPTSHLLLTSVVASFTMYAQFAYYANSNPGQRPLSLVSVVVMSILNGIFETFVFCFFFDLGANLVYRVEWYPMSRGPGVAGSGMVESTVAFLVGFHVFSVFSALIHAVMWGAHVLPKDYDCPRAGGKRTKQGSQRLLFGSIIPMSVLWFIPYFRYQDMWTMILCHVYADVWIAVSVHLPPPWAEKASSSSVPDGAIAAASSKQQATKKE